MTWEAWHRDAAGTDTTASAEIVSEPATSERKEEHLIGAPARQWAKTRRGADLGRAPCWAAAVRRGRKCGSAGLQPEREGEGERRPMKGKERAARQADRAENRGRRKKEGKFVFFFF